MLIYLLCFYWLFQINHQFGSIEGRVEFVDNNVSKQGAVALLSLGDSLLQKTYVSEQGNFEFKSVPIGTYSLSVRQIGYRVVTLNDVRVVEGAVVEVSIQYPHPVPCPFEYKRDYQPKCFGGHTDSIIPIEYGLPNLKLMKKAQKGKVHLGGCNVSDCDPKYYCTIHKREF